MRALQLDLGLQLGQAEVHHLIVQNALAEGLPAGGVFDGHADRAFHLHQAGAAAHSRSSWNCCIW